MHILKYQMFVAAALLAGVAIGYFAKDEPGVAEESETEEVAKRPVADMGEAASVKALRHRVAELEKLLAEQNAKGEAAISNAVADAQKRVPPGPPRGNWRERMEEMKKNDPARYTQMTNRFASWRRNRAAEARNKIDFLSSIDTSNMSKGARKTHEALQELIAKREEIERQLHQEGLSDETRGELMRELWSSHQELQRLNGEERKNLLGETARLLGFDGDEAQEITATVLEVFQATDSGWGGGRHGGARRGPPPGGQGGGSGGR